MKVRYYKLGESGIRIALLTDLHNKPWKKILAQVREEAPDLIAIAGDLVNGRTACEQLEGFFSACDQIAPTVLSLGNHDNLEVASFSAAIACSKTVVLNDTYLDTFIKGVPLRIGGLSSPLYYPAQEKKQEPNVDWLTDFGVSHSFKILLCHQPEFYPRYLAEYPIDLVLSGHAHGGQWRIGNQGVYAPGQGLFPKLTSGVTEFAHGKLVISRGLSNTTWIPRFFNPREIVIIEI